MTRSQKIDLGGWIFIAIFMAFLAVSAAMSPSCSAGQVKASLRHGNILAAKSLIAVYQESYDWLETEEGTYVFCKSEIPDAEDEAELIRNCEDKMAEFEKKFDRLLTSTALSLEVFEHSIDMWDSIDDNAKLRAIGDILTAFKDVERLLREANVDVPGEVTEAMSWLELIGNTLKDMDTEESDE